MTTQLLLFLLITLVVDQGYAEYYPTSVSRIIVLLKEPRNIA